MSLDTPQAHLDESARRVADRLSGLEGVELETGFELAPLTTLRVGGPADLWARVWTEPALAALLEAASEARLPLQVVGQGANLLIPDDGLRGVVCQLRGRFGTFEVSGSRVDAGSGMLLAKLALLTLKQDLVGLEPLAGFPATVGGAVVMNAGCYGTEIKDLLVEVRGFDGDGRPFSLGVDELRAGYRHTVLRERQSIVTRVVLQLEPGDGAAARERMRELNKRRWGSLPSGKPNAGSIFKNPPGDHAGRLIEACGLKGKRRGGASFSDRHANVIVNLGAARADDVLALMLDAHRAVKAQCGVELEPELVLTGSLAANWRQAVADEDAR